MSSGAAGGTERGLPLVCFHSLWRGIGAASGCLQRWVRPWRAHCICQSTTVARYVPIDALSTVHRPSLRRAVNTIMCPPPTYGSPHSTWTSSRLDAVIAYRSPLIPAAGARR
jgi:hypothetical protein